jgi:hypothetical protein
MAPAKKGGNMPFAATGIVTAGSLLLGTKLAQDVLRSPKSRKGSRQKGGMADLEEAFKGSLGVDTPAPVAESFASGPVAPSGGMSIQDNSVSQSGGKHRKPRSKKSCGGNPPNMPPVSLMGGKPRKAAHKKAPATRRHRGGGKPCEDDEKFECDDDGTPIYMDDNMRKPYVSSPDKESFGYDEEAAEADDFGFKPLSADTAQSPPSQSSDTAQLPSQSPPQLPPSQPGGSRNHRKHKKGGSDEQQQLLEQVNKLQQFIAQSAQSQKGGKKKAPKAKPVSPKRKPAAKKGPARKKVTVGGALQMYSQQLENLAKQINDMTRQ